MHSTVGQHGNLTTEQFACLIEGILFAVLRAPAGPIADTSIGCTSSWSYSLAAARTSLGAKTIFRYQAAFSQMLWCAWGLVSCC